MNTKEEIYFKTDTEWREWLAKNHDTSKGVYLIFYKLETKTPTMRWEEAVKVALCYGWIDSTVKSLGNGKRKQYFCPRKPKSIWSALNKKYIDELTQNGLMQKSGIASVTIAKENGSWASLDKVESLVIPEKLQNAFDQNKIAFNNYLNFAPSYKKQYLYWFHSAKREDTQQKRILEIIRLCEANLKTRN